MQPGCSNLNSRGLAGGPLGFVGNRTKSVKALKCGTLTQSEYSSGTLRLRIHAVSRPSAHMPLSDFKCLESGHYIVWTLYYEHLRYTRLPNSGSVDLGKYTERVITEYGRPQTFRTPIWCKTESGIHALHDMIQENLCQFEHCSHLEVKKELCVFDGSSLHSHTGKVWALEDVEGCLLYLQKDPSSKSVCRLLGKKPRKERPICQQCLAVWTCWCCCMDVDDLNSMVSKDTDQV